MLTVSNQRTSLVWLFLFSCPYRQRSLIFVCFLLRVVNFLPLRKQYLQIRLYSHDIINCWVKDIALPSMTLFLRMVICSNVSKFRSTTNSCSISRNCSSLSVLSSLYLMNSSHFLRISVYSSKRDSTHRPLLTRQVRFHCYSVLHFYIVREQYKLDKSDCTSQSKPLILS